MLNKKEIYIKLKEIISDLLDIDINVISSDTYIIRELEAESIDLMELAIDIKKEFTLASNTSFFSSDIIFLKNLRTDIVRYKSENKELFFELEKKYSHLSKERINDILEDISNGPVLKVSDIVDYIYAKQRQI